MEGNFGDLDDSLQIWQSFTNELQFSLLFIRVSLSTIFKPMLIGLIYHYAFDLFFSSRYSSHQHNNGYWSESITWEVTSIPHSQQQDSCSCGVYVMKVQHN